MKIKVLVISLFTVYSYSCSAQDVKNCNNNTTDRGWEKKIAPGVCIREGYTINFVEKDFDYNNDGVDDLAVRYTIYPIEDGNLSHYALFMGLAIDRYQFVKEFTSLSVPTIKNMTSQYYKDHPVADSLVKEYPVDRTIAFKNDTLILSMKISVEFGKSYSFIFNEKDKTWDLKQSELWIGQIPSWYVQNMQLDSYLISGKKTIESNEFEGRLTVDDFNLRKAYEMAKDEDVLYLESNYDIYEIGSKH